VQQWEGACEHGQGTDLNESLEEDLHARGARDSIGMIRNHPDKTMEELGRSVFGILCTNPLRT
jgi:hypothetical protein